MSEVGPLPTTARDGRIDALRGLALFGVLVMNLPVFARSPLASSWVESLVPGLANGGPALLAWFGQGKFLAILAGLYGMGARTRAERLGPAFRAVELRRLGFLAGLGVLHGLVWPGDILVAWALTGLVGARSVAFLGLFVPTLLVLGGYGSVAEPLRRAAVATHAEGWDALRVAWVYLPLQVPVMVAQAALIPTFAPKLGVPGVVMGLGLLLAALPALPMLGVAGIPAWLQTLAGDLGATAIALAVTAWVLRRQPGWLAGSLLAAVGAAPLSNYLLQTIIFVAWKPPRPHLWSVLGVAVVTFTALAFASRAWLRRFARGPVEAVWRRVTYG